MGKRLQSQGRFLHSGRQFQPCPAPCPRPSLAWQPGVAKGTTVRGQTGTLTPFLLDMLDTVRSDSLCHKLHSPAQGGRLVVEKGLGELRLRDRAVW